MVAIFQSVTGEGRRVESRRLSYSTCRDGFDRRCLGSYDPEEQEEPCDDARGTHRYDWGVVA